MSDLNDALLEARYLGVRQLPDAADAGDRRVREALKQEMAGKRYKRAGWPTRRIRIGGLAMTPVALLASVATAAAAAGAVLTISATALFQKDPQGRNINGDIETVLPSTVRQLATANIPDYGTVEVWAASTKPGGFCFAMKLPDGTWGGFPISKTGTWPDNGWAGGSVPGCFHSQQQQVLTDTPVQPGQQPTVNGDAGGGPVSVEHWDNAFHSDDGKSYTVYVGYVEADGTATTIRDLDSGATTQVLPGGYFVLAEPSLLCSQIPEMAWAVEPKGALLKSQPCDGLDKLEALDAAGQSLKPDYTYGQMLPGYTPGPSQS